MKAIVSAITVWMNSRRMIGSRPDVGSSSTSSSGSAQIAVTSASCVRCPFAEPLQELAVRDRPGPGLC
jgi:hypothetical protein